MSNEGRPALQVALIAVTVIPDRSIRRELARVLADAGWAVHTARDAADALRLCHHLEADVVLVHKAVDDGPLAFIDRLKMDSDAFDVAVVLVGDGFDVDVVVSAMNRGAADVLRTPLHPAEAVARATAAARTKALVKELTQHNDRIEELVLLDELTGLRNRRALMHDLETFIATARRHERSLSAVMIDVDRFKAINDLHGHQAGDAVLVEIARRIEGRLRDGDVAGRLGGDEMLVLLPETDAEGAATLAGSICEAVAMGPVQVPSEGPIDVTISLGSAAWEGEGSADLLERADRALYAAKGAGRDRAVAL